MADQSHGMERLVGLPNQLGDVGDLLDELRNGTVEFSFGCSSEATHLFGYSHKLYILKISC